MITSRRILDHAMSEADLQRTVMEMAQRLGYLAFHFPDEALAELATQRRWDAMPSAGVPDTWIVGYGRLIVAELKTERGRLSAAQRRWVAALEDVDGVDVRVWRPRDLDAVESELRRGAHQR